MDLERTNLNEWLYNNWVISISSFRWLLVIFWWRGFLMNQPNLTWFYFHIVLALIIIVKDYNGTLEESLNKFESKIGLYTYVDTSHREEAPYYIPPIEEEVDSTFILPDRLQIKKENK